MRAWVWAFLLWVPLGLGPSTARGQSTPPLDLTTVGTCPARDVVWEALAPVMPAGVAGGQAGASPRVVDLGDRFEVSAAGQRAQYADRRRDCAERARIAAVFIALALNPPALAPARPATPAAAPPPVPAPVVVVAPQAPVVVPAPAESVASTPAPGPSAFGPWWGTLGVAARVDAAAAGHQPSSTVVAPGVDVRAAIGRGFVGVFATAGVVAPTKAQFDSVSVRQHRFPLGLGVTARVGASTAWQGWGELGLAVAPFSVRAEGLSAGSTETRVDVGGRLAVGLRSPALAGGRIGGFSDLHAEVFPSPFQLEVEPLGDIGRTSRLWVGASLGAWFDFL